MNDGEIDDILKRGADSQPGVDPALVDQIASAVGSGLQAVRPLPAAWVWQAGLVAVCGAVGIGGALILGPYGVRKMDAAEIAAIFGGLSVLVWMAAAISGAEVVPGSRRRMAPWMLCAVCCIALAAIFGLLFSDYRTERFVAQGMTCLKAGLLHALPAMLVAALLLRRGVAVNSSAAGLAIGTLAGLAGVTMLELHCANFEAPHVMLWHIAVVPLSGLLGVLGAAASRKMVLHMQGHDT